MKLLSGKRKLTKFINVIKKITYIAQWLEKKLMQGLVIE